MLTAIIQKCRSSVSCVKQMQQIGYQAMSTVASAADDQEVEKFNKMGKDWWDPNSNMGILLSMNEIRVPFIRDGLIFNRVDPKNFASPTPLRELKILDVGCGGGYLTEALARIGGQMVGIDKGAEVIEAAKAHRDLDAEIKDKIHYEEVSIEDFASKHVEEFDALVSSEVIEHIADKEHFIKNCVACVKPGGSIFMTTINQTLWSNVLGICIAENVLGIVPKGAHDHDKFIAPHQLQSVFEDNDCYTIKVHGFTYNPITKNWFWVPFTDLNYAIHLVKGPEIY